MRGLLPLALALLCGLAHGRNPQGCGADIEAALRALNPKAAIRGEVAAHNCKPWPPSAAKVTAAVMAFEQPYKADDLREWIVVLALVDTATGRVRNSRRTIVGEDAVVAISSNSLTLDTAPYWVTPSLRALGVRYASSARGPSAPDASSGDELTLFVPEGRDLRPVFSQAMVRGRRGEGCADEACTLPLWHYADLTLAMKPVDGKPWADIVLTATLTRNGDSDKPAPPRFERSVYRYDGQAYHQAPGNTPWWDGHCCFVTW